MLAARQKDKKLEIINLKRTENEKADFIINGFNWI